MSELHAYDVDETLRRGNLTGDALRHGVEEGFFDPTKIENITLPTERDLEYFIGAMAGITRRQFTSLIELVADEAPTTTYPWALERLAENTHVHNIAVSHAPDFLVRPYAKALKMRAGNGSYFHTYNGKFSGRIGARHKVSTARRYAREHGLGDIHFAASDHVSDIKLLRAARRALVVNPDEELEKIAAECGWEIIRTD